MNVIGIVVEYNPFHNGHLYQINKIKEIFPDSVLVVCTTSSFSQRGEISLLNKFDKTKIAIDNGIDIVIELPYIYGTMSADIFAHYSIKLLNYLKIDTLVFGTEKENIDDIINCANTALNNSNYDTLVNDYMDLGYNYPTSLNKALNDLKCPSIKDPNDLLALSYIKEIIKNKYNIDYINIKRTNDYHDKYSNSSIVSSSNIRECILNKTCFSNKVPDSVYSLLKDVSLDNKYFELLKYKIISEKDLDKYIDVDEGIDSRIKKVINSSNNLNELILNIKSKRYTYNKISRMLNHILLSYTKDEFIKEIEYIRILGFSNRGQEYLNSIKKDISVPLLKSYNNNYKAFEVEKRVSGIYSLLYCDILKQEKSNKPIKE